VLPRGARFPVETVKKVGGVYRVKVAYAGSRLVALSMDDPLEQSLLRARLAKRHGRFVWGLADVRKTALLKTLHR